jgi:myo-inositol-1(or 4)-monophosphatase
MKLNKLAALICNAFSNNEDDALKTVQKVKDGNPRDVVTNMDYLLHTISKKFCMIEYSKSRFISEENNSDSSNELLLLTTHNFIVDPLDGSSNYSLGINCYGYMASQIEHGLITEALIVIPNQNQYILYDNSNYYLSQNLPKINNFNSKSGGVYYAYAPNQNDTEYNLRIQLFRDIDSHTGGFYRYGSACVGLYNLICGRHYGFIGQRIRIWDAISFMPILKKFNLIVKYNIEGKFITLIASRDANFIDIINATFFRSEIVLFDYTEKNILNITP